MYLVVISENFQRLSYSLNLFWGESGIVPASIVSDDRCKDGGIDLWAKFSLHKLQDCGAGNSGRSAPVKFRRSPSVDLCIAVTTCSKWAPSFGWGIHRRLIAVLYDFGHAEAALFGAKSDQQVQIT
jgi:hypothetical protein